MYKRFCKPIRIPTSQGVIVIYRQYLFLRCFIPGQLNKDKLALESLESHLDEVRSFQKDQHTKLKEMPSNDRVAKIEKNLENVVLKIESELKNTKHSSGNVDTKLKHLEHDKESLDKKLTDLQGKMADLVSSDNLQTDLRYVQDKLFNEITNIKSYANDQSKSLQAKLEKKIDTEIKKPFEKFSKELSDNR